MSMLRRVPSLCFVLVVVVILSPCASVGAEARPVEKLIAGAPDEALGFIATSGSDSLKPAFEKSIMGQVWNEPGVQSFVQSMEKIIAAQVIQEMGDPNAKEAMGMIQGIVQSVLSRPAIIGMAQKASQDGPPIYGFAILDAGPRKDEMAAGLAKLEAMAGAAGIVDVQLGSHTMRGPAQANGLPVYWGWVGNHLVLAINDKTGLTVQQLQKGTGAQADYLPAVPGTGDALVVHINWEGMFKILEGIVRMQGAEPELAKVQTVIQTLGLDGLKRLTVRAGFDGPDVVSNAVLETAQPRTGLLAHFKTIDLEMFDAVHTGAMNASAFNCDVTGVYDSVMETLRAVLGQEFTEVEDAITQLETQLKIKIRDGLLKSLDGQMVFYSAPGGPATGSLQGAFALVAKLKHRALWEETLTALGQFAASQSEGMLQISTQDHGGTSMHTWTAAPLAMLSLMPGWAVVGDKVVISTNPTFLRSAVDQLSTDKPSIRSTAGFKQATAQLPGKLLSLRFSDSKAQFQQMMLGMQQFWPMATMGAARAGVQIPSVLPNLSHIAERMGPSCEYSWFDDQGLRSHYRGTGIEPSIGAVAGAGLGMGIIMPALSRTRQLALRTQSATHLSGIGKALLIYANDYNDAFPPNLNELVGKAAIDARMLESPRKPKYFAGPGYIYITGQGTAMDPRNIVVYENPAYCQDGLNVLYLDSHVAWTKKEKFLLQLKETYERLGREMPEIKFNSP